MANEADKRRKLTSVLYFIQVFKVTGNHQVCYKTAMLPHYSFVIIAAVVKCLCGGRETSPHLCSADSITFSGPLGLLNLYNTYENTAALRRCWTWEWLEGAMSERCCSLLPHLNRLVLFFTSKASPFHNIL